MLAGVTFSCNATNIDTPCSGNGARAQSETKCNCNDFYTTFPSDSAYQCNYKQKNRALAFGLQLGLGCIGLPGIGNLYLGNIGFGVGSY
jgi:hypothetical protein